MICDQVLWLIKNSGLNFQLKETPFSLDICIKKRYVNLWQQENGNPVPNQSTFQFHHSQHQHSQESQEDIHLQEVSKLNQRLEALQTKHDDTLEDKVKVSSEILELDQNHRKLSKENKELQKKLEQVCHELKAVKLEKANVLKEKNALSVALQTCKKTLECSQQKFEKERNVLKNDLEKLNIYKIERESDIKK